MFRLTKRINRITYWYGVFLILIGLAIFIAFLLLYPFNPEKSGEFEAIPDIPAFIYLLVLAWFGVCLTRQRSNDISGENALLWMFLSLFLIGPIIGFIRGEKTRNKYGGVPTNNNLFEK